MPNNQLPGKLEDFITFMVPRNDLLFPLAEATVHDIPENYKPFKEKDTIKAIVHTWLAWQEDPGSPMGLAITKAYLNKDAQEVRPFIDWLNRLFND